MAAKRFANFFDVDYRDSSPLDVLKVARDMVHQGHKLHTHPVTSGTAPNGSPYVSVVMSAQVGDTDFNSVSIVESALEVYSKLGTLPELPEDFSKDFMLIDCEMLEKGGQ